MINNFETVLPWWEQWWNRENQGALPYGGHVGVFKDKEGIWRHVQYHMAMAPWVHELHVEDTGDDVIIMSKWEWEYQQSKKKEM